MFTGYFAKLKEYEESGLVPVSIAAKTPDWYKGLEYKKLAPKWEFFNEWKNGSHKGDDGYYIQCYTEEVLSQLAGADVIRELKELAGVDTDRIILLCYEKPADFCHRHIVADWLNVYRDLERDPYLGHVSEF